MKKDALIILLIFVLALTACQKKDSSNPSDGIDILGISDETDDAGQLVAKANLELKEIKVIYKDSEDGIKNLEAAMGANDAAKVKEVAGMLINQINKGTAIAQSAIAKIEEAGNMEINDTYREYLSLKKASLKKELEAFEFRRQSAVLLRDGFGGQNKQTIETAKTALKEREDKFKTLMQAAREMSEEANEIARKSINK